MPSTRTSLQTILTFVLVLAASIAWAQAGLPADIADAIRGKVGAGDVRYFDRAVDLNGDGKDEIVVYAYGPMVCGTGGCNLMVFAPQGSGHRLVSEISVVKLPVRASARRTSGWRDLIVHVGGGGGKSGDVALAFDGKSYPGNPTVPGPRVRPAGSVTEAELLIDDFTNFTDGKVLAAAAPAAPTQGVTASARPSFDCAKAATAVERLVCDDAALAALDRDLAAAYAKGLSPASDWSAADRDASRAAQREWISERNACAKQKDVRDCVASSYQRRLIVLRIRNGELMAPTPIGYRCTGLAGQPVFVAFYRETDPPSAVVSVGDRQAVAFLTQTASGAKYAAKGVELWEHHGEATLQWFGKKYVCKAV